MTSVHRLLFAPVGGARAVLPLWTAGCLVCSDHSAPAATGTNVLRQPRFARRHFSVIPGFDPALRCHRHRRGPGRYISTTARLLAAARWTPFRRVHAAAETGLAGLCPPFATPIDGEAVSKQRRDEPEQAMALYQPPADWPRGRHGGTGGGRGALTNWSPVSPVSQGWATACTRRSMPPGPCCWSTPAAGIERCRRRVGALLAFIVVNPAEALSRRASPWRLASRLLRHSALGHRGGGGSPGGYVCVGAVADRSRFTKISRLLVLHRLRTDTGEFRGWRSSLCCFAGRSACRCSRACCRLHPWRAW